MKHRLISSIKDENGNRHEIVSTRMKFETYNFFHKRHDLKVQLMRNKLKKISKFKRKDKQTTFCYCPNCKTELISSDSFVSDEDVVTYKCVKCSMVSEWDFDAPAPILLNTSYK